MSRALEARLKRLEKRLANRRRFPRVIFGISGERPAAIIGYEGRVGGARSTVLRQSGEPLEALQARAWQLVDSPFLCALYAPASERQGDFPTPEPDSKQERENMKSIDERRLDRASRKATNAAAEAGTPASNTPTAEAILEAAEAASATDPFALSGIGRVASRDELIRMGAIPAQPERPR